jgi:hypothetical protein
MFSWHYKSFPCPFARFYLCKPARPRQIFTQYAYCDQLKDEAKPTIPNFSAICLHRGIARPDRSLPSPLKRTVPFHGTAVPTEIERRGAFDAIMLVGTPVLQFLIVAAYGTE